MSDVKKTKRPKKMARLPKLSPAQQDELRGYFEGEEPQEPGCASSHSAAIQRHVRNGVAERGDYNTGRVEEEMVAYLDARRDYEDTQAKIEVCSDATIGVLAAWFAADEADRHRVINDDVLEAACDEWSRIERKYDE